MDISSCAYQEMMPQAEDTKVQVQGLRHATPPLNTIYMGARVVAGDKDQDFAAVIPRARRHSDGESLQWWGVVADGHGQGRVIELLRGLSWPAVCAEADPVRRLTGDVASLGPTVRDGATISIARVRAGVLECTWLGDSTMCLFKDGRRVWRSEDHTTRCKEELERAVRQGASVLPRGQNAIKVLSATELTMVLSPLIVLGPALWGRGDLLNMTRALGHACSTKSNGSRAPPGLSHTPGRWSCTLESGHSYKLLIGTDGFWDMICPADMAILGDVAWTTRRLADLALERWGQVWVYSHPDDKGGLSGTSERERIGGGRDDIGLVTWAFEVGSAV